MVGDRKRREIKKKKNKLNKHLDAYEREENIWKSRFINRAHVLRKDWDMENDKLIFCIFINNFVQGHEIEL